MMADSIVGGLAWQVMANSMDCSQGTSPTDL